MKRCHWCPQKAVREVGGLPYCIEHFKEFLKLRWHPENGWQAMKLFAKECFPDIVKPEFGNCSFHDDIDKFMHFGFVKAKSAHEAMFGCYSARGHAKTTKVTINSVYAIAYNLKRFIIYRTDSLEKAKQNYLDPLKFCLQSRMFMFVFGDLRPQRWEVKDGLKYIEGLIILANKANTKVLPMGLEQSSRSSRSRTGARPDLIIEDDIESIDNTKSEPSIQYIHDKLKGEDMPALDIATGMMIFTQTPIVPNGVYQYVLNSPGFKVTEKPLYKKDQSGNFLVDADGNFVPEWPERFSIDRCKALEAQYSSSAQDRKYFAREYLLQLTASDDHQIPESNIHFCQCLHKYEMGFNWIQITEIDGETVKKPKWELADITFSLDPATSEDGRACDSCGIFLATLSGQRRIVLDMFHGKYRARDIVKLEPNSKRLGLYDIEMDYNRIDKRGVVGEMYRRCWTWTPNRAAIETVVEYENTLREIMYSYDNWYTIRTKHRMDFCNYKPGAHEGRKRDRAFNLVEPDFMAHRVYFRGEKKIVRDESTGKVLEKTVPFRPLYDQIVGFGETKKFDAFDSLSIAFRFSETPEMVTEEEKENELHEEEEHINPWVAMHAVV